jgi:hypothetical protein
MRRRPQRRSRSNRGANADRKNERLAVVEQVVALDWRERARRFASAESNDPESDNDNDDDARTEASSARHSQDVGRWCVTLSWGSLRGGRGHAVAQGAAH